VHAATRVALIALLVGLTLGAGVHYEAVDETHWPYPSEDRIGADYDRHVGERTFLFGTVTAVEGPSTITVDVETDTDDFELTARGVSAAVRPGGTVQLLGTLRSDHRMTVQRAVVVNPASGSVAYKYAVSAVGALFVLVVFFGSWRADVDRLRFEPRTMNTCTSSCAGVRHTAMSRLLDYVGKAPSDEHPRRSTARGSSRRDPSGTA